MKNIGFILFMGLPFLTFIIGCPLIILGMAGIIDPEYVDWVLITLVATWIVSGLMLLIGRN